jgi:large subunit ribosomal protein L20
MPRASNSPARRRRRKRTLKKAKGYYGARSRQYKTAANAVERAKVDAYRDRKRRKREFRRLWITRINAACRLRDMNYSAFIDGLKKAGVSVNRKMLSELAIADADAFDQLVETARAATSD